MKSANYYLKANHSCAINICKIAQTTKPFYLTPTGANVDGRFSHQRLRKAVAHFSADRIGLLDFERFIQKWHTFQRRLHILISSV
jgi:hypothetical protein